MTDGRRLHLARGSSGDGTYDVVVTPESAGWTYSGLRTLRLLPGRSHTLATQDTEVVVLPLNGECTVSVGEVHRHLHGRDSVFASATDFAYVGPGSQVRISSQYGGLFALPSARIGKGRLPVRYGRRDDVRAELRGAGSCSRLVNNYCMPGTFEAERLMVCEVITPGGNWSSFPPHKHDEARSDSQGKAVESELEEIYYFEVAGEHGFAYQRVYGTVERPVDVLAEVRSGDAVLIPHGWHGPSIATPGYDLYYLNVMAGAGYERAWLICDDPAHSWIRDSWEAQPVDPRLLPRFHSTAAAKEVVER